MSEYFNLPGFPVLASNSERLISAREMRALVYYMESVPCWPRVNGYKVNPETGLESTKQTYEVVE